MKKITKDLKRGKRNADTEGRAGRKGYFLAWLLPLVVFSLVLVAMKVVPFGNKHLIVVDAYHQYVPFLSELRRKLLDFETLFYSLRTGLGTNFYSLMAYYLLSPFNLLLVLFPDGSMSLAVSVLTALKISSLGLTMFTFLKRGLNLKDHEGLLLSLAYALSGFIVAYYWNFMWLDVLILMPLVSLGVRRLVEEGKVSLYITTLTLSIIFNYYIAFFLAGFTILYFFVTLCDTRFSETQEPKERPLKTIWRFFWSSAVAGLLSAPLTLPVLHSLRLSSAAGDMFPEELVQDGAVLDLLAELLSGKVVNFRQGPPNIYIGAIAFVFLPLFYISRKVPRHKKISRTAVAMFLILSFNLNSLNFIWHGFHYPNQLDNRFAFVFVFLMLEMCGQAIMHHGLQADKTLGKSVGVGLFILLLINQFYYNRVATSAFIITLLLILAWGGLFALQKKGAGRYKKALPWLMILLLAGDLGMTFGINLSQFDDGGLGDKKFYTDKYYRFVTEFVEQNPLDIDFEKDRVDIIDYPLTNSGALLGARGTRAFASTFPLDLTISLEGLGFTTNGINAYVQDYKPEPLEALFSVNYKIVPKKVGYVSTSAADMVYEDDDYAVYQNRLVLPEAFRVSSLVESFEDYESMNAAQNIEDMYLYLSGNTKATELFEPATVSAVFHQPQHDIWLEEAEEVPEDEIIVNFNLDQNAESAYFEVLVDVVEDGPQYLFLSDRNFNYNGISSVYVYDHPSSRDGLWIYPEDCDGTLIVPLGDREADESISANVYLKLEPYGYGSLRTYAQTVDLKALEDIVGDIDKVAFDTESIHGRKMSYRGEGKEGEYLLVNLPYDAGFSAKVNGITTEVLPWFDAFMLVPLQDGECLVELSFLPVNFLAGLGIAFVGVIILVLRKPLAPKTRALSLALQEKRQARKRNKGKGQAASKASKGLAGKKRGGGNGK